MTTANIHVKVDSKIKAETEDVLDQIGISMSDLFNMTMRRVIIERRLPFDTTVPEIELPDEMSVNSIDEWKELVSERLNNDDGSRYTASEVREMLGLKKGEPTSD